MQNTVSFYKHKYRIKEKNAQYLENGETRDLIIRSKKG